MPIETIKSYEDLCQVQGLDPVKSLPFPEATTPEEKAINGFTKIIRAIAYLNNGWVPDWNDSSQWKYYPWWDMRADRKAGSGVGFSAHGYLCDGSDSFVGSRLVLKNRQLVEHMAKYFIEDYKAFMTIEK